MSNPIDLRELKLALQAEGYIAPEYGLEDCIDPETWAALYSYAMAQELEWPLEAFEAEDGDVPQAVLDSLLARDASFALADPLFFFDSPISYADEKTVVLTDKYPNEKRKLSRNSKRKVSEITSIVLHQTAVKFGTGLRETAPPDKVREALHRRFCAVGCHVAALMNGDALHVNSWESYVIHGNRSNRFSVGIEIEGLYAGLKGKPSTVRGKPTELGPRTIAAARKAVRFVVEQCRAKGCPLGKIAAHRQFAGDRIADPGEEIWREVALWAVKEFSLAIDYDYQLDKGRRIPREWDPSGAVNYYDPGRATGGKG